MLNKTTHAISFYQYYPIKSTNSLGGFKSEFFEQKYNIPDIVECLELVRNEYLKLIHKRKFVFDTVTQKVVSANEEDFGFSQMDDFFTLRIGAKPQPQKNTIISTRTKAGISNILLIQKKKLKKRENI